ncbi:pentatricopeptide repeat (PPR) superfamily protein [Wolffia australiana]
MQDLLKRGFSPTIQSAMANSRENGARFADKPIVRALLKLGRFEEAENRLLQCRELRNSSQNCLWDSLIRGVCVEGKDPEKGFELLLRCVRYDSVLRPSLNTFRSLVFGFSSRGRMDRALEVVDFMNSEEVGYPVDNYISSSVVSGFVKLGKPELGLNFFKNLIKDQVLVPNLVTYTAVLDALLKSGNIKEASEMVQRMEDEGVPRDCFFYACRASCFIHQGAIKEALHEHKLMVEKRIDPDVVNYSILVDGFCKEGNVEKVIGLLRLMRARRVEPNLITYTSVIHGFCKRGKIKEATDLLRMIEELGVSVDEFAYSTLICGWCVQGDFEMVFKLLDEMEERGIEIGPITRNTVIHGLCKHGNTAKANELLAASDGDLAGLSAILSGHLKESNESGVLEIVKRMEEKISLDVIGCNICIRAYFFLGMFEDAILLFRRMPEMGLAADSFTFMSVIKGLCKLGMVDEALEILDDCVSRVLEPDMAFLGSVILGLCKAGMVEAAVEAFLGLCSRGLVLKPDILQMLIRMMYDKDQGMGVLKLMGSLYNTHLRPELLSLVCSDAISFLCRRKSNEAAKELFILAKRYNWIISLNSYHLLTKTLLQNGDTDLVSLFMGFCIKEYGISEPGVLNLLTLYLCKKDVGKALQLCSLIGKREVPCSVSTTIVETLKKAGRIEEAYRLAWEAGENGMAADVVTYSVIVDGLCRVGRLEKALKLCLRMRYLGIQPNIVIYNSILKGLCLQGCLIEAMRIFDALGALNVTPTDVTFNVMIHGLATEGYLIDARNMFEKLIVSEIMPNLRIYNTMINGYCRSGAVGEGLELLLRLEERSVQPDSFTISSLINGFCVLGDMEGALGFYADYKKRGIVPDYLGFLKLTEGLISKGRLEEARSILLDMLQSRNIIDVLNKAQLVVDREYLLASLSLLCEEGRIDDAVVVLSEVGSMNSPVGRFIRNHGSSALRRTYKRGRYLPTANSASPSLGMCFSGLNSQQEYRPELKAEEVGDLIDESNFLDFDVYYPVVASLCSNGELQKASSALRYVMENSRKLP